MKHGNSKRDACPFENDLNTLLSQIGQEHPLNLSISLSGGKETN